jgi:iron-sulfur cluster assembly protein
MDAEEIPPPRLLVTPVALSRIREMIEEAALEDEGGLRISARPGAGCSAPFQFGLFLEAKPKRDDVVMEFEETRIFMDPTSAWSLDGLLVEWVEDPDLGDGFAFRHPRGAGGRAC